MKPQLRPLFLSLAFTLLLMGCSDTQSSPDVKTSVESSLTQAGLTTVKVAQNREKGVITLSGEVTSEQDKQKAAELAKAAASTLVVANEIGVRPVGNESDAKKIDSSLDTAIEKNFDAMVIGKTVAKDVKFASKNSVLTLSGSVASQNNRAEVESRQLQFPM
jgi:hyperosmotically inducible protein